MSSELQNRILQPKEALGVTMPINTSNFLFPLVKLFQFFFLLGRSSNLGQKYWSKSVGKITQTKQKIVKMWSHPSVVLLSWYLHKTDITVPL